MNSKEKQRAERAEHTFVYRRVSEILRELNLTSDDLKEIEIHLESKFNSVLLEKIPSKLRMPHADLRDRLDKYIKALNVVLKQLEWLHLFESDFDNQFEEIKDLFSETFGKKGDYVAACEIYRKHIQAAHHAGMRMLSIVNAHPAKKGRRLTVSSRDAMLASMEDKLCGVVPTISASRARALAAELMTLFGDASLFVDASIDTSTARKASKRARELKG